MSAELVEIHTRLEEMLDLLQSILDELKQLNEKGK